MEVSHYRALEDAGKKEVVYFKFDFGEEQFID
jgi:hypothetical protein